MNKVLLQEIADQENYDLKDYNRLTGGDINEVFRLTSSQGDFVVKVNDSHNFPHMFKREAEGLELMRQSNTFRIPTVKSYGQIRDKAYLLLEFLHSSAEQAGFWKDFGQKLADMHRETRQTFGLDHDNYIGSLPQFNQSNSTDAAEFYIEKRLEPQFKMAKDSGFGFQKLDRFFKNIAGEIPREKPALVHGDLWGGNYMSGPGGEPVLIDPATAFAPREMDIGMMNLFGGFSEEVFEIYHESFPLVENWEKRVGIWQLYYLLVHLNLFGEMYLGAVQRIHREFS